MSGSTSTAARSVDWRSSPGVELTPILECALEAFNEHGYDGTTVRDIAQRVGVSVPALYYHHANKEAILYDLLDTAIEYLHRQIALALEDAGPDSVQRFLHLVECIVLYIARVTKLAHLDAEIRSLSPERRAEYSAKRHHVERLLQETIAEAAAAGAFDVRSPRDAARALLGMFQAIAIWYRPGGELGPEELAVRYLDLAAHAVGAKPAVVRRVRARVDVVDAPLRAAGGPRRR
jgi:AcrR family transcriptional regulator